jgi:hypothetical protein
MATAHTEVKRRHTVFLRAKDAEIRRQATEAAQRAEEAAWHARQQAEATGDAVAFAEAALAEAEQHAAEQVAFGPLLETTRVKTAAGAHSGLKDNWLYALDDIAAVPPAFLSVNDKMVKAAIASGTRRIPGLRIYNEPKAR